MGQLILVQIYLKRGTIRQRDIGKKGNWKEQKKEGFAEQTIVRLTLVSWLAELPSHLYCVESDLQVSYVRKLLTPYPLGHRLTTAPTLLRPNQISTNIVSL